MYYIFLLPFHTRFTTKRIQQQFLFECLCHKIYYWPSYIHHDFTCETQKTVVNIYILVFAKMYIYICMYLCICWIHSTEGFTNVPWHNAQFSLLTGFFFFNDFLSGVWEILYLVRFLRALTCNCESYYRLLTVDENLLYIRNVFIAFIYMYMYVSIYIYYTSIYLCYKGARPSLGSPLNLFEGRMRTRWVKKDY